MVKPLDERIACAFRKPDEITADDVGSLIVEVEKAAATAEREAKEAEAAELDPALLPDEVDAKAEESDRAARKHRRLGNAPGRLRELQHERREAEAEAVRVREYERARELRDAVATEIRKNIRRFKSSC